jgi:hypothetical protein
VCRFGGAVGPVAAVWSQPDDRFDSVAVHLCIPTDARDVHAPAIHAVAVPVLAGCLLGQPLGRQSRTARGRCSTPRNRQPLRRSQRERGGRSHFYHSPIFPCALSARGSSASRRPLPHVARRNAISRWAFSPTIIPLRRLESKAQRRDARVNGGGVKRRSGAGHASPDEETQVLEPLACAQHPGIDGA